MKRKTKEDFIEDAIKIHGDKYDYSKVEYINAHIKVCIVCPKHGEFWQTPASHLNGRECPKCSNENSTNFKKSKEYFIQRALAKHGDKCDYSKVEYVDSTTPVCIICPEHGEFWQTPSNHTNKNKPKGCCVCGKNKSKEKSKLQLSEFINKSNIIHNNKYDYSNVKYKNYRTPVCIVCPKHGEFWQTPSHHLNNEGCPVCNTSKLENEVENVLKTNNINFIFQYSPNWANKFRYDFYLIESNIIIECQGEQHYYPVDFGGKGEEISEQNFRNNVENDRRKYNLAIENGCKILYYTKEELKKNDEITNINDLIQKIKQL